MKLKWDLPTKVLVLASIPLCFQVLLVVALTALDSRRESNLRELQRHMAANADGLSASSDLIEIYVKADAGHEMYLATSDFTDLHLSVMKKLTHLKTLLVGKPEEFQAASRAMEDSQRLADLVADTKAKFLSGSLGGGLAGGAFKQVSKEAEGAMGKATASMRLLVSHGMFQTDRLVTDLSQIDQDYMALLHYGLILESLTVGACLLWLSTDLTARFKVITDNAYRLASNQPLNQRVGGTDEISQIDAAFHALQGRLAELKRNEQIIAEHARAVMCILDEKLSFVEISIAASRVFATNPDELLQLRVARLLWPEDVPNPLLVFEQIKDGTLQTFETRCNRKDGALIETEWSVQWSGAEKLFFCTIYDISERRQAERLRLEIIRMVTSDLSKPLVAITECLQNLERPAFAVLSEKGKTLRARALSAASQMSILVQDLLDLEATEAGVIQLNCSAISARELINQSIYLTGGVSVTYGVSVEARGDNFDMYVDGDRVVQILVNLISNAIKFSSRGGIVVVESIKTSQSVGFKVCDSGRGIPAHLLPVIFDRFRQVQVSDAKEKGGSGLGLAICKALVDLHDGEITVTSTVNQGTTFTVQLPIARPKKGISSQ